MERTARDMKAAVTARPNTVPQEVGRAEPPGEQGGLSRRTWNMVLSTEKEKWRYGNGERAIILLYSE